MLRRTWCGSYETGAIIYELNYVLSDSVLWDGCCCDASDFFVLEQRLDWIGGPIYHCLILCTV